MERPSPSCDRSIHRRLTAEVLIDRWRSVPAVDPIAFRADIDAVVDPDL
jgi:hypothetical protein